MINKVKQLLGLGPEPDFAGLVKQGAIILDVRSKREFAEGHISSSINISVDKLNTSMDLFKDKRRPIITCCASGERSTQARAILKAKGFPEVHDGGGWRNLKSKIS